MMTTTMLVEGCQKGMTAHQGWPPKFQEFFQCKNVIMSECKQILRKQHGYKPRKYFHFILTTLRIIHINKYYKCTRDFFSRRRIASNCHIRQTIYSTRFGVRMCLLVLWSKNFQSPPHSLPKFKNFYCKMRLFVKITHFLLLQLHKCCTLNR